MLRLNLLGAVDVVDAGHSRNGDVGGTKPLALLVYLVITGRDKPIRRDTVAALLWPESEQKNARQSLNQALSQLRGVLGDDVIRSRGQEELDVDFERIGCDCFDFAELAQSGRLEEAVDIYRGEFAHGLYVKESPEFDDWMSRQRSFWRDGFADVLAKLYRAAVNESDLGRATTWATRLLDVAPERDEPVRELLPLLVNAGNHTAAIRLYAQYKRSLEEFDVAPPADLARLIDDLPRAPGIFSNRRKPTLHIADPPKRPRHAKVFAIGIVAIAVTFFAGRQIGVFQSHASGVRVETAVPKVAVIELAATGTTSRAANVLGDALEWRLRDAGFEVLNTGGADTTDVRKLANITGRSGLTFVVGGDVETLADASIVARIWLKEAGSGKKFWESSFTQKEQNVHLIATHLSEAIAGEIRRAAGSAAELASSGEKVSADSWRDVYRARERLEAAVAMRLAGSANGVANDLKDAETMLLRVSQHEPDWALPWLLRARIAESRAVTAMMAGDSRRGAVELERGIRLLDTAAANLHSEELYELRGKLQYARWWFGVDDVASANRLLARAEADLNRALGSGEQRSNSYAALSGVMFAQGKYAESFVYARRAYDSNVFLRRNDEILNRLFNSAFHAGDDASATHWCNEINNAGPGSWPAVLCRIHVAGYTGRSEDLAAIAAAITNLDAAPPIRAAMQPRLEAAYAITLAQAGMQDSARAILAALEGTADTEVILFTAFALATLNDTVQAQAALKKYLSEYAGTRANVLNMRWLH